MSQLESMLPEETTPSVNPSRRSLDPVKFVRQYYIQILLGGCLLLAAFLRLYDLTGVPNGLNQDEAANGIDAYSLGQTLRDHHGNFLPVLLETYQDWASSLLTYLTIPFVWVFGLTGFAVRLPVALIGIATVYMMFSYVKKLTNRANLGLLAAFLLAVSPWHIISSRWGIPPEIVPFFLLLLLNVYLMVRPGETKYWKFGAIGLCASLLVYSYPTQKMFVPLLLGIFFLSEFFNKIDFKYLVKKYFVIGATFLVITSPVFYLAFLGGDKYNFRFNAISIFKISPDPLKDFISNILTYFDPTNIFNGAGNIFFLLIFNYLGIAACILKIFFRKPFLNIITKQQAFILLMWWLIAPLPASFTRDYFNANRFTHGYATTIIFSIIGIAITGAFLKKKFEKIPLEKTLYITVVLASFIFLYFFTSVYFTLFKETSKEPFQYGIEEFSTYLIQHKADFDTVTIEGELNQPYIFKLFYSKQDPNTYNYDEINFNRKGIVTGLAGIPKLDNYYYSKFEPETIAGATEIYDVKDENGLVWYRIYAKDRQWFVVKEDHHIVYSN